MESSRHAHDRAHRVKQRAVEVRRFVVLFLYLWALFGVFVLYERIVLTQRGMGFSLQGFALFNALALAKVMLAAEDLNLGGCLHRRPRIYPNCMSPFSLWLCSSASTSSRKWSLDSSRERQLRQACRHLVAAVSRVSLALQ